MYVLEEKEIELLRRLIGMTSLRLYTLNMSVDWGKSALVPDLSIAVGQFEWLILGSEIGYLDEHAYEFNYLSVSTSDSPKGAKYIEDAQGHKILDKFVGHISIGRPNRVDYIEVLRFHGQIDEHGDPGVEYDRGLVIGLDDGRPNRPRIGSCSCRANALHYGRFIH